jgi:hypothetical protein
MSKAAKMRAKKAAAEAERERAIAEAKLTARDYAAEENAAISAKLKPRALKIVEVPSDGNCLFAALLPLLVYATLPPIRASALRAILTLDA